VYLRSYSEYVECSCGGWARIVRAEDRQYRDKIVCAKCGRITVQDNIPMGIRVELKEWEGDADSETDSSD
jgi:transcription initiation factor TFIIIB Brf1 subunit/transcription initiation factor TFIIB